MSRSANRFLQLWITTKRYSLHHQQQRHKKTETAAGQKSNRRKYLSIIYCPCGIWAPPNIGWKPFSSAIKLIVYVCPSNATHDMAPVTDSTSFSVPGFLITPSSDLDTPSLVSYLFHAGRWNWLLRNRNQLIMELVSVDSYKVECVNGTEVVTIMITSEINIVFLRKFVTIDAVVLAFISQHFGTGCCIVDGSGNG